MKPAMLIAGISEDPENDGSPRQGLEFLAFIEDALFGLTLTQLCPRMPQRVLGRSCRNGDDFGSISIPGPAGCPETRFGQVCNSFTQEISLPGVGQYEPCGVLALLPSLSHRSHDRPKH